MSLTVPLIVVCAKVLIDNTISTVVKNCLVVKIDMVMESSLNSAQRNGEAIVVTTPIRKFFCAKGKIWKNVRMCRYANVQIKKKPEQDYSGLLPKPTTVTLL